MCNEFRNDEHKEQVFSAASEERRRYYTAQTPDDTPFFHHVAMLKELQEAAKSGKLYTYHFNMLRSILEKTATFFGFNDFSACHQTAMTTIRTGRFTTVMSNF